MNNIHKNMLILSVILLVSIIGVVLAEISTANDTVTTVSDKSDVVNVSDKPDVAVVDISAGSTHSVERLDECIDEKYVESVQQYGNCSYDINVCDDAPVNQSCHKITKVYTCNTGSLNVETTHKNCQTKGYKISKYKLDTEEYACSVDTIDKDSTVIICDSKYDGNGDGICTSGESCMKYVITKDSIQSYEKNSKDEYQPSDESYFLNKINVEEVQ